MVVFLDEFMFLLIFPQTGELHGDNKLNKTQPRTKMELRLGFRVTLVWLILALTLSSQRVEAQRAGTQDTFDYNTWCRVSACS